MDILSDDESTELTEVLFSPAKESDSIGIRIVFLKKKLQKLWINAQIESKTDTHIFYRYFVLVDKDKVSSVRGVLKKSKENEQFVWLNSKMAQIQKSNLYQICSTSNSVFIDSKMNIRYSSNDTMIINFTDRFLESEGDEIELSEDILWCVCPFVRAYSQKWKQFGLVNISQTRKTKIIKSTKEWESLDGVTESEKSLLESLLFAFHLNSDFKESFVMGVLGHAGCGKKFVCQSIARMLGRHIIDFDQNFLDNYSTDKAQLDSFLFLVNHLTTNEKSNILKKVRSPVLVMIIGEDLEKVREVQKVDYLLKLRLPSQKELLDVADQTIPHYLVQRCSTYHQIHKYQKLIQLNNQIPTDQSLLLLIAEQLYSY